MGIFKKAKYEPNLSEEKSFTAYIVKGNRQVITREVIASKRFRIGEDSYIINPDCIFRKNINGRLKSVSYYREGNPNPYDFEHENIGLTSNELDYFYAEDFFNIVVNLEIDKKTVYILLVVILNFALCLVFDIGVLVNEFLF